LHERLGMQAGCKIDMSVSDLPRVMRMPGTINQATGRRAAIIRAGHPSKYLAKILVNHVPLDHMSLPSPVERTGSIIWQAAMPYLSQTARDFINSGASEPGRHKLMWHTARTLKEAGCDRDETKKALTWGNMMCRPKPLDEAEIDKILAQEYLDAAE
jgi:hypothetical protein